MQKRRGGGAVGTLQIPLPTLYVRLSTPVSLYISLVKYSSKKGYKHIKLQNNSSRHQIFLSLEELLTHLFGLVQLIGMSVASRSVLFAKTRKSTRKYTAFRIKLRIYIFLSNSCRCQCDGDKPTQQVAIRQE